MDAVPMESVAAGIGRYDWLIGCHGFKTHRAVFRVLCGVRDLEMDVWGHFLGA